MANLQVCMQSWFAANVKASPSVGAWNQMTGPFGRFLLGMPSCSICNSNYNV